MPTFTGKKVAKNRPERRSGGGEANALLALSPRTVMRAESPQMRGENAFSGESGEKSGGESGERSGGSSERQRNRNSDEQHTKVFDESTMLPSTSRKEVTKASDMPISHWSWKSFFAGMVFSIVLAAVVLCTLGGASPSTGETQLLKVRLVQEEGGRQTSIVLDSSVSSRQREKLV